MGRAKSKVQSWESIVEELGQEESRHIIRRTKQTPFIQVRDTTDKTSQASLRPLRAWGGIEDVVRAIEATGHAFTWHWLIEL